MSLGCRSRGEETCCARGSRRVAPHKERPTWTWMPLSALALSWAADGRAGAFWRTAWATPCRAAGVCQPFHAAAAHAARRRDGKAHTHTDRCRYLAGSFGDRGPGADGLRNFSASRAFWRVGPLPMPMARGPWPMGPWPFPVFQAGQPFGAVPHRMLSTSAESWSPLQIDPLRAVCGLCLGPLRVYGAVAPPLAGPGAALRLRPRAHVAPAVSSASLLVVPLGKW